MHSALLENVVSVPADTLNKSPTSGTRRLVTKASASPWGWMAVTCVLLVVSGGIRYWRDRQFQTLARESATCPFPLSDLPKLLGSWEGGGPESRLDPQIARIAGSSDHIIRTYTDRKSNETVSVLVLYGLANSVFGHTPEACYPTADYQPVTEPKPVNHELSVPGSAIPLRCRSVFFSKSIGGIEQYEEVYFTFLHNGQWVPEVASRWKSFRYHPGMFKIQIQRHVSKPSIGESPSESLLMEIVREIDTRISQKTNTAKVATPAQTARGQG